jgi:hypothetical protein
MRGRHSLHSRSFWRLSQVVVWEQADGSWKAWSIHRLQPRCEPFSIDQWLQTKLPGGWCYLDRHARVANVFSIEGRTTAMLQFFVEKSDGVSPDYS